MGFLLYNIFYICLVLNKTKRWYNIYIRFTDNGFRGAKPLKL